MNFIEQKNGNVDGFALIKSIDKKINVKGAAYLDLILCDKDGEIAAKLWDYKEDVHGEYAVNDLIKFRGLLSQYNGADQLRIDRIRHTTEIDGVRVSDFVPTAEYTGEMMLGEVYNIIDTFRDADLRKITKALVDENTEKLLYWPAAFKLHHAIRGGLLYHTLSILRVAEAVCKVYPNIDRELLLSGAILHDLAKIKEYEVSETGVATSYSVKGNLIGHLVMGAMEIEKKAEQLGIPEEKAMLLEHMAISHHGVPEFGAAVRPLFIEAEVLCQLDTMDAVIYEMSQSIGDVKPGEFTQRQWALENRKLYNHGRLEIKPKANLE
ncbi:MAG: HD domain-containing protein [Ruminococcaceae bacterium]|nr:HD domain-containing protein [Oscillospiraceae bacterium]